MDFLLGLILLLLLLLPLVFLLLKSSSGKEVSVKHTIPLPIYFGSQTGTAERYANQLQDLAKTQNFSPSVLELNTLTIEVLQSLPAILIVCSTQGKGDPPDNTSKFLKMVQTAAKQKEVSLSNLSFAVFGLGSMEYMDTFNRVPKLIREALILLGAVEVHAAMLSDETLDMDTDFREWSTVILDVMKGLKVADAAAVEAALNTKTKFLQVKTNVKEGTPDSTWNYERASEQYLSGCKCHAGTMRLRRAELIKADPDHPVYSMELDCCGSSYITAQDIALFPINSEEAIEQVAKLQGYDLNTSFTFLPQKQDVVPFPTPCTLRQALRSYCDLAGPVRKDLISHLMNYASDPEDKERLKSLRDLPLAEFETRVAGPKLTIVDILKRYPSVKCPFHEFVQILGRVSPRYFTIASSSLKLPDRIQLCVAILKEATSQSKQWTGLCTGYLETQCQSGAFQDLRVFLDVSKFTLPLIDVPLVMVTNGCGVAPFRAFIQEMQYLSTRNYNTDQGKTFSNVYLFFGCQSASKGFLFKSEFENALLPCADPPKEHEYRAEQPGSAGVITHLFCAFSRDQPKKIYIQEVFAKHQSMVADLVFNKGGYIFLCGSEGMVTDVHKILQHQAELLHPGKGPQTMSILQQEKRFVQESWG